MPRPEPKTSRRLRTALVLFLANAFCLALFFAVGETYFRIRSQGIDSYWPGDLDPVAGFIFKPYSRVASTNDEDYWVEQQSNSEGFLDREPPAAETVRNKMRIALVGDSFIEGVQVPLADKVQVKLEGLLNDKLGGDVVRTYGYGYSGTGQATELGFYDKFIRGKQVQLVVLIFVYNDFSNNSAILEAMRTGNGWDPLHAPRSHALLDPKTGTYSLNKIDMDWARHRLQQPESIGGNATLRAIYKLSRFYRWVAGRLSQAFDCPKDVFSGNPHPEVAPVTYYYRQLAARDALKYYFNKGETPPDVTQHRLDYEYMEEKFSPFFQEAIHATAFALNQWNIRSQRDDFKLVAFITHSITGRQHDRLVALLDEKGIPYCDMNAFLARRGIDRNEANFRHDGHWNIRGHAWAAESLAEYLLERGLVAALSAAGIAAGKESGL
jgi:hypothetical protein